ncbi:MAG: hypothetical protein C5B55_00405 [Blastocatellia bacterium]|nr:MAG: hypothetical protein C5B55_00405 [Blastocatellia bacterium]
MTRHRTTSIELDDETAQLLAQVARKLGVSEEEAIKRALDKAIVRDVSARKKDRLDILKKLQRRLALTSAKAEDWNSAIREARR